MFLTIDDANNITGLLALVVIGLSAILFVLPLQTSTTIIMFSALVVSSGVVLWLVDLYTPARRTKDLQKLIPSLEFIDRIKCIKDDSDNSSDSEKKEMTTYKPFCAKVAQYYRQDLKTANLPFPLGLAHENFTKLKNEAGTAILKIEETNRQWASEGDQLAVWNGMKLQTEQMLQTIQQCIDFIEIHPQFHSQYQSCQTYESRKNSETAVRLAKEAKSSADSASTWAMLSFFRKS